ncbi:MAG: tetratricopeptide repeat protein, partial [Brevinematales bacterium]
MPSGRIINKNVIMKPILILSLLFILSAFILSSCASGPSGIRHETVTGGYTAGKTNISGIETRLYDYYRVFREGRNKVAKDCPPRFLSALSNEFITSIMTGGSAFSNALIDYSALTNDPDDLSGFLYQRIGVVLYKLGDYEESYRFINTAIYEGSKNPELYYYKALLLYYYKKDFSGAEIYLTRLDNPGQFLNRQEILFLKACLKCETGDYAAALPIFMTAKDLDPARFYTEYDILPYFIRSGITGDLDIYINDSYKYLTSLSNSLYRVKAYRQLITYNRLQNRETLYIPFDLPGNYDYITNLVYFFPSSYPVIEKRKSMNIISPLQEKRLSVRDLIYSPVYEEYFDSGTENYLFLQEGIVKLTNLRLQPVSFFNPMAKILTVSNVMLLLSPTNRFELTTNFDRHDTNQIYVVSNVDNVIFRTNCNFDYYFMTGLFAMDGGANWDVVTLGITTNNRVVADIFYPLQKKMASYSFSLKRHDSTFVIQDIRGDSNPEVILLDDDVYILNKTNK